MSNINDLMWSGDTDLPDPYSGLSLRDIRIVQKQWEVMYAKAGDYGLELFLRLFRRSPSSQSTFSIVDGLSEAEIAKKPLFQAHVQNFMAYLNATMLNLNNPVVAAALMNKLGTTHKRHRIQKHHFEDFKAILVDFLTNDLKLNKSSLESWGRVITFLYKHIYEKLNE